MRLPPEARLPIILVLTVAQCAIAAPYFIAKAQNGIGAACSILCFVAPPVVFWLFMLEIGDLQKKLRAALLG